MKNHDCYILGLKLLGVYFAALFFTQLIEAVFNYLYAVGALPPVERANLLKPSVFLFPFIFQSVAKVFTAWILLTKSESIARVIEPKNSEPSTPETV